MYIILDSLKIAIMYSICFSFLVFVIYFIYEKRKTLMNKISCLPKKIDSKEIEKELKEKKKIELEIGEVLYIIRDWKNRNFFSAENGKVLVEEIKEYKTKNNKPMEEKKKQIENNKEKEHEHFGFNVVETKDGKIQIVSKDGFIEMSEEGLKTVSFSEKTKNNKEDLKKVEKLVFDDEEKICAEEYKSKREEELSEAKEEKKETEPISFIAKQTSRNMAKSLMTNKKPKKKIEKYLLQYSFEDIEYFFKNQFLLENQTYEKNIKNFITHLFQFPNVFIIENSYRIIIEISSFIEIILSIIKEQDRELFLKQICVDSFIDFETINKALAILDNKLSLLTHSSFFDFNNSSTGKIFILYRGIKIKNNKIHGRFVQINLKGREKILEENESKVGQCDVLANSKEEIKNHFTGKEIKAKTKEDLKLCQN